MEPDPYTMTGDDATGQAGLLQILQRIQEAQNRPLIPDNPLSQLGAAMQGFSAGYAGQQNPAITLGLQQRQQELAGLHQTASVLGHLADMAHKERDYKLRVDMEQRRITAEEDKNKRDAQHQYLQTMLPLAKEWGTSKDPLTRSAGLDLQQSLLKKIGADIPDGLFEQLKKQTEDTEEIRKSVAHAIVQGVPDDAIMRMYPGQTPEKIQMAKSLLQGSDDARTLWGLPTRLGMDKQRAEAAKVTAEAEKSMLDLSNERRIAHLNALPARTPLQDRELLELQSMKGAPDLVRSLTIALMRKDGLPLELAAPRAKKLMAEVTHQEKDFEKAKQQLMQANPGMTEGEAFLEVTSKLNAVKKTDDKYLNTLDRALDIVGQVEGYSKKVNTATTGLGAVLKAPVMAGRSMLKDEDIRGLQRQQAYLAVIGQELQKDTRFSDADRQMMEVLIPSIYDPGPVAQASIKELRALLNKKRAQETAREQSAKSLGALGTRPAPALPADPNDPLGWHKRRGMGER